MERRGVWHVDVARLRALRVRMVDAIRELDAMRPLDPAAASAAAIARRVGHDLNLDGLAAVTRVLADTSLRTWSAPPPDGSAVSATAPADVSRWWSSLDEPTQRRLVVTSPAAVGNLDGVPAADRDLANRLQLARDLAGEPTAATLAVAACLEAAAESTDPRSGDLVVVQLYAYDPAAFDGAGIAAIATGDLDSAHHVAVTVAGFDSDVAGMRVDEAQRIYREARRASGDAVAVLEWVGYDAPSFDLHVPELVTGESSGLPFVVAELAGVAGIGAATDGAARLAALVDGLRVMRGGGAQPHLTVVGHSYGSTTAAIAADRFDLAADDLVLTGSPGAGTAGTADDLTTGASHTWVASPSSDVVTMLGHSDGGIRLVGALGNDPAMDTFGAVRIAAENVGRGTPWNPLDVVAEHQSQFADGSESLYNVAAIVVGDYAGVLLAEPRHQRPVVELGWPIEFNWWPAEPEARRAPTSPRHVID